MAQPARAGAVPERDRAKPGRQVEVTTERVSTATPTGRYFAYRPSRTSGATYGTRKTGTARCRSSTHAATSRGNVPRGSTEPPERWTAGTGVSGGSRQRTCLLTRTCSRRCGGASWIWSISATSASRSSCWAPSRTTLAGSSRGIAARWVAWNRSTRLGQRCKDSWETLRNWRSAPARRVACARSGGSSPTFSARRRPPDRVD